MRSFLSALALVLVSTVAEAKTAAVPVSFDKLLDVSGLVRSRPQAIVVPDVSKPGAATLIELRVTRPTPSLHRRCPNRAAR